MSKRICERCHEEREVAKGRKICHACRRQVWNIAAGTVRPPDYPETTVARYKEPMEAVENGFGYIGAITETKDGKQIQCHICGFFYASVATHLARHGIKARDYKIKFGLRITAGLLSPVAREEAQAAYNNDIRSSLEKLQHMTKMTEKLAQKRQKDGEWVIGGNTKESPQYRNERGTCRAQTIAKIRALAERNDGVATWEAFTQEYGSGEAAKHWFGTWDKAVEAAGLTTHESRLHEERATVPERLLAFYEKHGRTPQFSDLKSENDLPSYKMIHRLYGSLNNARTAAGVPQLVQSGRGPWVEVVV